MRSVDHGHAHAAALTPAEQTGRCWALEARAYTQLFYQSLECAQQDVEAHLECGLKPICSPKIVRWPDGVDGQYEGATLVLCPPAVPRLCQIRRSPRPSRGFVPPAGPAFCQNCRAQATGYMPEKGAATFEGLLRAFSCGWLRETGGARR